MEHIPSPTHTWDFAGVVKDLVLGGSSWMSLIRTQEEWK